MFSEDSVLRYVRALYPVGAMLLIVPVSDLLLRSYPPQFGTLEWRFGFTGLLVGNYGTLILGAFLLGFGAVLAGDRRVLRGLGIGALIVAVVTLALLALFGLDAVQMRGLVNPAMRSKVFTSSLGVIITGLLGALAWFSIGRAALAAGRTGRLAAAPRRTTAAPLVATAAPAPRSAGEVA